MASFTAPTLDELERLVHRIAASNKAHRRTLVTRIDNILEADDDKARLQRMSAAALASDGAVAAIIELFSGSNEVFTPALHVFSALCETRAIRDVVSAQHPHVMPLAVRLISSSSGKQQGHVVDIVGRLSQEAPLARSATEEGAIELLVGIIRDADTNRWRARFLRDRQQDALEAGSKSRRGAAAGAADRRLSGSVRRRRGLRGSLHDQHP
jgi:hypothetical protein